MKVLFICKASIETGLGHLIRCKTLASTFQDVLKNEGFIKLIAIGPNKILSPLLKDEEFNSEIFSDSYALLNLKEKWDFIFFDMLDLETLLFEKLREQTSYTVSISPIFDRLSSVDILFHRTKHHNLSKSELPKIKYMGLDYAIIQKNCKRIGAGRFEENLQNDSFPIAVSMGGGDAANKTLSFLKTLRQCQVPATIWVMLGEGYQHSYDKLIHESRKNTRLEIILARTNKSMWHILQNCVLGIFPGGITTYEAAYAGLPAINIYNHKRQLFLIRELIDNGAAYLGGKTGNESYLRINELIEYLYNSRIDIMNMHLKSKSLIDGKGKERIFTICLDTLNGY